MNILTIRDAEKQGLELFLQYARELDNVTIPRR
jgi:hypothetical protein